MIKNITKNLMLVLFVGTLSFQAQAQGMKERTADKAYDILAFAKAGEMYSELASKSDATDRQIRRAAECYRFIGDSETAEMWYRKLSTNAGVKAEDFYHFAQMLKLNEKYDEANKVMATFKSKAPNNSIAAAHADNSDYVADLKSMPNKYNIAIFDVNTKTSDFGPNYYTKDGVTDIVFASARTQNTGAFSPRFQWDGSNFLDAYVADIGGDGENVKVSKFYKRDVKSKYHEGPVSFSNNGDVMYLTRSNYLEKETGLDSAMHNNLKLYIAKKDSSGDWGNLVDFPYNSDYYSLGHASVTEDGKTMYFTSDMPGAKGETDIWMSTLEGSKWSKPMNLADVNTEGREMFPYINENGNLYFSSDGYAGLGGLDVYRANAKSASSFDAPENMMYPLNTNHDDFGLIINQKETEGYFSSNRDGGSAVGNDDIYRFQMLQPFKPKFYTITGCAKTEDEQIISSTNIKLINTETGETIKKKLSQSGCYEFENVPSGKYRVEGMKPQWDKISDYEFNTDDSEGVNIEDADVYLKEPDCSLLGAVVNGNNNEPLSGVKLIIKDKRTGRVKSYLSDAKGQFTDALDNIPCPGGYLDYEISLEKEGFFPKTVDFTHAIVKPGVVDLSAYLGGPIPMFDAGAFCQINDILYDFDKSYIRPDAAIELDKLVQCMKDNPDLVVEIGSHTDCRATIAYNIALSDRRAKAARAYVIAKGIDPKRIYGRGYGESRLLKNCPCEPTNDSDCSEELHQLNRRTEFRIVTGGENVKNNSTNSF